MKVIKVPMDENLLHAMTLRARAARLTPAALIRRACEEYMHKLEEEELDRRYVEGYRRNPETPGLGRAGVKLAAQVWRKEGWS
jgi:hypothetical protein